MRVVCALLLSISYLVCLQTAKPFTQLSDYAVAIGVHPSCRAKSSLSARVLTVLAMLADALCHVGMQLSLCCTLVAARGYRRMSPSCSMRRWL